MSTGSLAFPGNRQRSLFFAAWPILILLWMVVTPPLCRSADAGGAEERAKTMALVEIEGEIAGLHVQLAEAQTQLENRQQKLQDLIKRPAQLRRRIARYEETLSQLREKLARPMPEDESPRLIRARRTSLSAQQSALEAQLRAADREVAVFTREMAVTRNRQALATRKIHRLETLIKTWESVREHRQSDVGYIQLRQTQESLREMAADDWPKDGDFLRKLAERNRSLSETLIELDTKEQQAGKTAKLLETRLDQIRKDFELTRRRVKMMGLTRKAGQWLQSRRETLRKSRANPRVALQRRNEILRANLANDDLLQERQDYLVLKNNIYDQLDNLEASLSPKQTEALTMQAFLLLESRRKLLEETGNAYINYLKQLHRLPAGLEPDRNGLAAAGPGPCQRRPAAGVKSGSGKTGSPCPAGYTPGYRRRPPGYPAGE